MYTNCDPGCMRMRKLAYGQSVMFLAPSEIDRQIRAAASKTHLETIHPVDVLRWCMLETCKDIDRHVPRWAQQGVQFKTRCLSSEASSIESESVDVQLVRDGWMETEARTLEELYNFDGSSKSTFVVLAAPHLQDIRKRCCKLGFFSLADTHMEEEQEREVSHEVERERQVERPPKASPASHHVHPDVSHLVNTGQLKMYSLAFVSPFTPFNEPLVTTENQGWSPCILATSDFVKTIETHTLGSSTDFLRPVNWILSTSHSGKQKLVIMSPYEVNVLLPKIRTSSNVHLHIYTPRVTQSMPSFDDLLFYSIPPLSPTWTSPQAALRNQLNLFAGQLFLRDFATYSQVCAFLGLHATGYDAPDGVLADGFVPPHLRGPGSTSRFTNSPVPFMRLLMSSRRHGVNYDTTHLGKILHARPLTEKDFDECDRESRNDDASLIY
jgi:hypothetical protein